MLDNTKLRAGLMLPFPASILNGMNQTGAGGKSDTYLLALKHPQVLRRVGRLWTPGDRNGREENPDDGDASV